jgi:hypothetical protein
MGRVLSLLGGGRLGAHPGSLIESAAASRHEGTSAYPGVDKSNTFEGKRARQCSGMGAPPQT